MRDNYIITKKYRLNRPYATRNGKDYRMRDNYMELQRNIN